MEYALIVFRQICIMAMMVGVGFLLAKLLKLDAPLKKRVRMPLSFEETGDSSSDSREILVPAVRNGQTLAQLKLPEGALVLMIRRDEKFIVPRGDTSLAEGDILTVMGTPSAVSASVDLLSATEKKEEKREEK